MTNKEKREQIREAVKEWKIELNLSLSNFAEICLADAILKIMNKYKFSAILELDGEGESPLKNLEKGLHELSIRVCNLEAKQ